jgi:glutamate-5-semialdehyde dehydrogenase
LTRLELTSVLLGARRAARGLQAADRNAVLKCVAQSLTRESARILAANNEDVVAAKDSMSAALLDRLMLTPERLHAIIESIAQLQNLPDPLGQVERAWTHPKGMHMRKLSVPFGVIGMIYESRPNVTVDAAMLCLKAGSATVLRGSSNALASNRALVAAMRTGLQAAGTDPNAICLIDSKDRAVVLDLLRARGQIDLIIPRGGGELIRYVTEHARVPVIETGTGVCHLYVHRSADLGQALAILIDGKVRRPGVCNALETLLVDEAIAATFLPLVGAALHALGVELRACEASLAHLPASAHALPAAASDFGTEFLDLILAIKIVPDIDAAIAHIQQFGTQHSEAICAAAPEALAQFSAEVDAAAVYCNASTRFTDGFEFGFGAEIGISTQKLHARGPMGLAQMVTHKYLIDGTGQVRSGEVA